MIAVLGSRFDEPVREAVASWNAWDEVVWLTVDDLLTAGWFVPAHDISDSKFVAGGRVLPARELKGVINLMPRVYDFEMLGIRHRDRRYVSGELFAFLVWWLCALPCPVLNRPTAGCLNGPSWRPEQWARACQRADIPALPVHSDSLESPSRPNAGSEEVRTTTVVRKHAYGAIYAKECRALSAVAGTEFLEVFFRRLNGNWVFHGANLVPTIQRTEVRDMLRNAFLNKPIEAEDGANLGIAGR